MLINISRVIKYGFLNFVRNGWLSFAAITVMLLTLLVFGGLVLFNVITKATINSLQNKIDISIYFKNNVSEDAILSLKSSLEKLEEIKSVEYISQEKALEEFKAKHKDEPVISQALQEFSDNPLLASLNIKAKDPHQYAMIADYLNNASISNLVEKISYTQNQIVIDRLTAIVDAVERVGVGLNIFLALVAALVIFTTIRLAIYSNSEQIAIMRLVGGSNWFIRGPYIIEGILYGLIGGILSFLIWIPLVKFSYPYVLSFISEINLWEYFQTHFILFLGYQLMLGIFLGIVSSIIAIRRYLKT